MLYMQTQFHFFLLVFPAAPGHGVFHDAVPPHPQNGEEVWCLALQGGTQWKRAPLPDGIKLLCSPQPCHFTTSLEHLCSSPLPRGSVQFPAVSPLCSPLSPFILPKSNTTEREGTPIYFWQGQKSHWLSRPLSTFLVYIIFVFFAWTNSLLEGRMDVETMNNILMPTHPTLGQREHMKLLMPSTRVFFMEWSLFVCLFSPM